MGLNFSVKCENGAGFLSPNSSVVFDQRILDFKALGGVPVLRRIVLKPKETKFSVIPSDRTSPILPAGAFLSPM